MTVAYRYKKSTPGDFYINYKGANHPYDDCCTAGGSPHLSAPEFCDYEDINENRYCFVKKQPKSPGDIYQMLRAIYSCEFNCLRYRGTDSDIIQRITDISRGESVCDFPNSGDQTHIVRNRCTFDVVSSADLSQMKIGRLLRNHVLESGNSRSYAFRVKATSLQEDEQEGVTFSYSWTDISEQEYLVEALERIKGKQNEARLTQFYKGMAKKLADRPKIYHPITLKKLSSGGFIITHSPVEQPGSMSVSMRVHDFLTESNIFNDIRWYTENEWEDGKPTFWRATPY